MPTPSTLHIEALRKEMKAHGFSAYIIPSTDPHLSEYVAPHWEARKWISGFTGSAGTVVVTLTKAGLWTDSRYFLQAAEELEGSDITLFKEMLPDTPSIAAFLSKELQAGSKVGINGMTCAAGTFEMLHYELAQKNIELTDAPDLIDAIWEDRPQIPQNEVYIYNVEYAGKTCTEKLEDIRRKLQEEGADGMLVSALDEIAWTLNLRGNDVKCNPFFVSYLLIGNHCATLFVNPQKVNADVQSYLHNEGVEIKDYNDIQEILKGYPSPSVLLNPALTNYRLYAEIGSICKIIRRASPIVLLKAIRNAQEMEGLRNAMQKDGVAMVRFLRWLENAPIEQETELSVTRKLHEFRSEQPLFMGDSFDTIAGYGAHGAIVHYSATEKSNATLSRKGFLLLDSGGQYLDGTTDITRTIPLGELTKEEKVDYTLVLKGHINLAMAIFPQGTRGTQLDVLAHGPLWKHGMNFLHGTGHGVGHFLNVHEGPQSIRMNENPVALLPGMLTSNEPGVYKSGSHGVRIENLLLTQKAFEGMYGDYLSFETVTLCPISTLPIVKDLLSKEEIEWLNNYHRMVHDRLADQLNEEEKEWILRFILPI